MSIPNDISIGAERIRRLTDAEAVVFIKAVAEQIRPVRNALGGKGSIYFISVEKNLKKVFVAARRSK